MLIFVKMSLHAANYFPSEPYFIANDKNENTTVKQFFTHLWKIIALFW